MKITVENKPYDLVDFYNTVAREMGYTDTSDLHYDCRKVNIAKNIQDGFYKYYEASANPDANEFFDVLVDITMLLACSGPKVDEALKANEVEIFDGFIC